MTSTRYIALSAALALQPMCVECDDGGGGTEGPTPTTCVTSYGGFEVLDGVDNDCDGYIDDFATPLTLPNIPLLVNDLENLFQEENYDFSDGWSASDEGVFTPDGAHAYLTSEKRALFLTLDGNLRGGNAKPLDEGTTDEFPDADSFVFVQGADILAGLVTGTWVTELPDNPADKTRSGTTIFEIDPITGARRDVIGRVEDQYFNYARFSPDGRLIATGVDAQNRPVIYLDALGDRIELSPPAGIDDAPLIVAPWDDGEVFACSGGTAVQIAADGDLENAFGLNYACPAYWEFASNGLLFLATSEADGYGHPDPGEPLVVMDIRNQYKSFTLFQDSAPSSIYYDVSPTTDHVWFYADEVDLDGSDEYNVYVLDLYE